MKLAISILAGWFLAAVAAARTGWLLQVPAAAGFAMLPAAALAFAVLNRTSGAFHSFVRSRDLRWVTRFQALRLFGLLAFVKADQGILPDLFAVPTGIIDVTFAITSFWVAGRLVSPSRTPGPGFLVWHLAGIAGLATSAILAILTSTTRWGFTEAGITSQTLMQFPMVMAVIFFGPAVLVLHLAAIAGASPTLREAAPRYEPFGGGFRDSPR